MEVDINDAEGEHINGWIYAALCKRLWTPPYPIAHLSAVSRTYDSSIFEVGEPCLRDIEIIVILFPVNHYVIRPHIYSVLIPIHTNPQTF